AQHLRLHGFGKSVNLGGRRLPERSRQQNGVDHCLMTSAAFRGTRGFRAPVVASIIAGKGIAFVTMERIKAAFVTLTIQIAAAAKVVISVVEFADIPPAPLTPSVDGMIGNDLRSGRSRHGDGGAAVIRVDEVEANGGARRA